jgi:hypothetical protein
LCDRLPTDRHEQAGVHTKCGQIFTQGRQEEVGLALDPADLPLARVKGIGQFDLREPGGATYLAKVKHGAMSLPYAVGATLKSRLRSSLVQTG